MFLTRIGFGSKAVVTGDVTQVDVPGGRSGLTGLEQVLAGIDGLAFVHLTSRDVVRHRIVQDIVDAYERATTPPMTRRPFPARRRSAAGGPRRARLEVFVADEQSDQPVDVARWRQLAERRARAEGVRGDAELSLLFVDEVDRRAERAVHGRATARPTCWRSRSTTTSASQGRWPDGGTTGPDPSRSEPGDPPLLLGDVVICPAVAARNAPEHAGSYDDELALLVVHGILHVLGHGPRRPRGGSGDAGPRTRAARPLPPSLSTSRPRDRSARRRVAVV